MTVPAKVAGLLPESYYQGTTYEQQVVVDLHGALVGFYDYDLLIDPSLIGEEVDLEIYPYKPTSAQIVENCEAGVTPNEEDPHYFKHHCYCGEVVEATSTWPRTVTLDLDPGKVSVKFTNDDLSDRVEEIEIGDFIETSITRSDIHSVEY